MNQQFYARPIYHSHDFTPKVERKTHDQAVDIEATDCISEKRIKTQNPRTRRVAQQFEKQEKARELGLQQAIFEIKQANFQKDIGGKQYWSN